MAVLIQCMLKLCEHLCVSSGGFNITAQKGGEFMYALLVLVLVIACTPARVVYQDDTIQRTCNVYNRGYVTEPDYHIICERHNLVVEK